MAEREWHVGKLLSISSGFWKSCAVHAAVRLQLFTVLHNSWRWATDIADALGGDQRGVTHLLNALVAMGLLRKNGEMQYGNTAFSAAYLDKTSPQYMGHIILHHHHLVDGWAQLDQAVLTGQPVEMRSYGEAVERESFLMGMFNLAMRNAPKVAGLVDLSRRKHLLDLGGGPGTYAIHFCLANPDLQATVYDRATTRAFAVRTLERFGVSDRITFQTGDFITDGIDGCYDAAWLSHILHSNGPQACEKIIAKTAAVVEPGGLIMVHEFFLNDTLDAPEFPALFTLNMLINNGQGRSYAEKEIRDMLAGHGVVDIHRLPSYQSPNDAYVLCGTVT
jgi:predicted O-methyltransferase YrrM